MRVTDADGNSSSPSARRSRSARARSAQESEEKGGTGRHHPAGADRVRAIDRDEPDHSEDRAVVQLPAADDHRRHGHGSSGDAARPRPDQVLVMVNGKRRHAERARQREQLRRPRLERRRSQRHPGSAIESIEILRDGAAAQYGSDAIAGVINLVLKSSPQPLEVEAKVGATTHATDRCST
jgi:hypothetical protein